MKKADQAKSIATKLSSLSKSRGVPYQIISTTFLLERLLARLLLDSQLSKTLIFKGGYVGLRVYESPRYTIDLDAILHRADADETLKRALDSVQKDIGDGVWFHLESQINLKTQGEYGGTRQVFRTGIGEPLKDLRRAQTVHFDIGIGDPVTPGPVKTRTEELIGEDELSWLVYPVETIAAEKLHALVDRGGNNSRAKDIYDLHFYLPQADGTILTTAIERCFSFRGTPIPPDIPGLLSKIDSTLLKKGWKSATISLKEAPDFDEALDGIVKELRRNLTRGARK
ncbi:MAG: hypothetical protein C5B49_01300 [Bdellovibrio sp.]|nr:MAG: hypothetical protein C5B49_01300 [Bdellovibrio sp.]